MDNKTISESFSFLSAPLVADACLRAGLSLRVVLSGGRPIRAGMKLASVLCVITAPLEKLEQQAKQHFVQ